MTGKLQLQYRDNLRPDDDDATETLSAIDDSFRIVDLDQIAKQYDCAIEILSYQPR